MATLRLAAQYATALTTDSSRTTRGVDTPSTHDCRSDRLSVIYITHLPAPGPTVVSWKIVLIYTVKLGELRYFSMFLA